MMERRYSLAEEPFRTIQGEGRNAGRAAVFVRFAGCNLWNGVEADRERDAERMGVECPRWCDTDFRPRLTMLEPDLIRAIVAHGDTGLVVFTGGEPFLQLTASLLHGVRHCMEVAVETNGTREPRGDVGAMLDHICVSPKVSPDCLRLVVGDELKVVVPGYDPLVYQAAVDRGELDFSDLLVQPQADPNGLRYVGGAVPQHIHQATQFVLDNPRWRLSYQLHKVIEVP